MRVEAFERTEVELHLVEPASSKTACGLPLAGLAYATPQGFDRHQGTKHCRRCSYAFVTPCQGRCGKKLRWYERNADGLCLRCVGTRRPTVDEPAGYVIYKNRVFRSATIHRTWCRQVRESRRLRSLVVSATGWYVDDLSTMTDAEHKARTEGWEVRSCGVCSP